MVSISAVRIEVFPANQGDAILISSEKKNILIDAGVSKTYDLHLRDRLKMLAAAGEVIDLFIVTHIDDDHIGGAIEFIRENMSAADPVIIPINEVWHNSFKHLQAVKEDRLGEGERRILNGIISAGSIRRTKNLSQQSKDISANQGSTLAALILKGGYKWNSTFGGAAVKVDYFEKVIELEGIEILLLSPNDEKLQSLSKKWEKELKRSKFNFKVSSDSIFDDAFEYSMLMENNKEGLTGVKPISSSVTQLDPFLEKDQFDNSITNGSSIAIILKVSGKRVLLLGDSHPDLIANSLEKLKIKNSDNVKFDIVKLSHHGSSKNTTSQLIKLIDSNKYIVSTDGSKHNHPDLCTLAKIVAHSETKEKIIYCNYKTANSEYFRTDAKLRDQYNYQIVYPEELNTPLVIEL